MKNTEFNSVIQHHVKELLKKEGLYKLTIGSACNIKPVITDKGFEYITDCVNELIDLHDAEQILDLGKKYKAYNYFEFINPAKYVNSLGDERYSYLPDLYNNKSVSLFLAGPCNDEMYTKTDWRATFIEELAKKLSNHEFYNLYPLIKIYTPTTDAPNELDLSNRKKEKLYHNWCRNVMDDVNYIVFWIPRYIDKGELGLHTNIEIGRYLSTSKKRCLIGWPKDADKVSYIEDLIAAVNSEWPRDNLADLAVLTRSAIIRALNNK